MFSEYSRSLIPKPPQKITTFTARSLPDRPRGRAWPPHTPRPSVRPTAGCCCPLRRSYRHPPLQLRFDLVERLPGAVFGRNLADAQRPLETEAAIVVHQASLGVRRVELSGLVAGLGAVLEHLVAMSEPLRHVQRPVVVGAQLDGDVLQVGGALRPQVDDDVEDRSARGPHQLGLGGRGLL